MNSTPTASVTETSDLSSTQAPHISTENPHGSNVAYDGYPVGSTHSVITADMGHNHSILPPGVMFSSIPHGYYDPQSAGYAPYMMAAPMAANFQPIMYPGPGHAYYDHSRVNGAFAPHMYTGNMYPMVHPIPVPVPIKLRNGEYAMGEDSGYRGNWRQRDSQMQRTSYSRSRHQPTQQQRYSTNHPKHRSFIHRPSAGQQTQPPNAINGDEPATGIPLGSDDGETPPDELRVSMAQPIISNTVSVYCDPATPMDMETTNFSFIDYQPGESFQPVSPDVPEQEAGSQTQVFSQDFLEKNPRLKGNFEQQLRATSPVLVHPAKDLSQEVKPGELSVADIMETIKFGELSVSDIANFSYRQRVAESGRTKFLLKIPCASRQTNAADDGASISKSWADLLRSSSNFKSNAASHNASPNALRKTLSFKQICELSFDKLEQMDQFPAHIVPRGLVNNGNLCFMNAILQPLLYCRPLFVLFHLIKRNSVQSLSSSPASGLSLVEAMILFVNSFRMSSELVKQNDPPFAPVFVYEALRQYRRMETTRGSQEDAQEFLGFLLDGLHEQFLGTVKDERQRDRPTSNAVLSAEDEDWVEIGRNRKPCVYRQVDHQTTPITTLFEGQVRNITRNNYGNSKESVIVEPFRALHVDVSGDDLTSLEDLLERSFAPETISSATGGSQQRQLLFETLPPVLILHLKRFIYAEDMVQKIRRFVSFPVVLQMKDQWMSPICRGKLNAGNDSRGVSYRLTAVVYHHGKTATGGHYTTDLLISHTESQWIRVDDDVVLPISVSQVLEPKPERQAYLFFYNKL